ncbi:MAG: DUF294 nucleotidyltransferase-like domain-containing protein [Legionellaceae bacterium]|nr:DUF294 nucleotidyltransferase-like domain-containing protein [Legionellaceae bacterium]
MINLISLFKASGYITKKQQVAFMQLLVNCCAFEPLLQVPVAKTKETFFSKNLAMHSDLFLNFQDGLQWLVTTLNEHLLLTDFHKKTAHVQKVYSDQLRKLPTNIEQHKKRLPKILKTLGMLQGNSWPNQDEIGHVVLLGEMEDVIMSRLQFIEDFQGDLYYLTNPRGLFNHEPSLAAILAAWFELDGAQHTIQNVLNKHRNISNSNKNWLHDLAGLKDEILIALQTNFGLLSLQWPVGKGHYYYEYLASSIEQRENIYDMAAKIDNRTPISDWPTSVDMVNYHLTQARSSKGRFTRVNLIPVLAMGENKPATIYDSFKEWCRLYQQNIPDQALLVVVSGNERNHAFLYNKAVIESQLANNTRFNTVIVGPSADKIYYQRALSEFSKSLYQRQRSILDQVSLLSNQVALHAWHQQLKLEHPIAKQSKIKILNNTDGVVTRESSDINFVSMVSFFNGLSLNDILQHTQSKEALLNKIKEALLLDKKYMLLFMIIQLEKMYIVEKNYIQSHALHYFSINIVNRLKLPFYPSITFIDENITKLHRIRIAILRAVNRLHDVPNRQTITTLYQLIQCNMNQFIVSMIEQAIQQTGHPLSEYAIISMGSYARGEETPFSDIEFFILTKETHLSVINYFKTMTKFLLLRMLSLGETVLPALGEPFSQTYDPITRQGVSFDPYLTRASKTPLGRKDGDRLIYRLIGTPKDIAVLTLSTHPDPVLSQMLLSGSFLAGNPAIYEEYTTIINAVNYCGYGFAMLKMEVSRYLSMDHDHQVKRKRITHKNDALKPSSGPQK